MAHVNLTSLREEFGIYQKNYSELCSAGKCPPEAMALISGLIGLLKVLIAVFLEKTTLKDSKNSSKPPSQTEKDETTPSTPGTHGKGTSTVSEKAQNTRTVETTKVIHVTGCSNCGHDLSDTASEGLARRIKIDLVFEKVATNVDAEIKTCPNCQEQTRGEFPKELSGPKQFGDGFKSFALCLLVAQMIPFRRVYQLLSTFVDELISEATLVKWVLGLHKRLERWEKEAIEEILTHQTMHADETSMRVNKQRWWVHVYSSMTITLKFLHRRRGLVAMNEIGIIPRFLGVVVHDCWSAYLSYFHCRHALCGAHLLRELAFIVQTNGYRWARHMRRLLKETCKNVSRRKAKKLSSSESDRLTSTYRSILTRGQNEMGLPPVRQNGKRGRIAKSDAQNLLDRMKKYEEAILRFAKEADTPFTNNAAERALRMSKVKQKISGCFRQEMMAHAYCRISSYLQTMANKGINPNLAIEMALTGKIYEQDGPFTEAAKKREQAVARAERRVQINLASDFPTFHAL